MARDGFILYKGFYEPIEQFSDEQLGRLFRALYLYQLQGLEEVAPDIRVAFGFFKHQFEIDDAKYSEKVAQATKASRSRASYRATTDDNGRHRAIADDINKYKYENEYQYENKNENKCGVCVNTPGEGEPHTTPHTLDYLRVLFFRNIPKAEQETHRFEGYYESTGWKLQGGDTLEGEERLGRAQVWKPQDETPRFPRAFVDAWWALWQVLPEELRKPALKDRTAIKESDAELRIYCHPNLRAWLLGEGKDAGARAFAPYLAKGKRINIYNY